MRNICQRDIFFYMNEELRIPQKVMCSIFNKVRQGNMVETRISEIKQGKRRGYRGLKEALLFRVLSRKCGGRGLPEAVEFCSQRRALFSGCGEKRRR